MHQYGLLAAAKKPFLLLRLASFDPLWGGGGHPPALEKHPHLRVN